MLLAIDTSAGTSVAVVDADGVVRAERSEADAMRHAEVVGRLIAECLAEASASGADITAVVAGMGPGPFTGLRVGIAAARVFALAIDRPLLALASHDALALAHYEAGHHGRLVVTTDARRRELFWSRYSGLDAHGLPVRTAGPGLVKPAELTAELEAEIERKSEIETRPEIERKSEIEIGPGIECMSEIETGPGIETDPEIKTEPETVLRAGAESGSTTRVDATEIAASQLGIIAARRLAAGLPFEPDEALYLRSPDVTPPTGIKRVTR